MPVIEQDRTEERQAAPTSPEISPPPVKRAKPVMIAGGAVAVVLMFLGVVLAISNTGNGTSPVAPEPTPAAAAPAPAPAAVASLGVTLKEFTVTPGSTVGRAGRVTFKVSNAGAVAHEFVVLRTNTPAAGLLKGAKASEAGNVGETGDMKVGATKTLVLNLKAGHYALICNLPGHYQAGQHTDFTVR
jgi:uncharacterized cupredoxin-like copper-binding protein